MQQSSPFPLVWDPESGAAPAGVYADASVRCLWRCGLWSNRTQLLHEAGLSAELPEDEALAALHAKLGGELARRVAGCLRWVIWDGRRRELILTRDRMGLGGLYWRRRGRRIEISPEIEPLLPPRLDTGRLNLRSVASHLRGGAPLAGETFHEDVHSVPPGGLDVFTYDGVRRHSYWKPVPGRFLKLGDREGAERLWALLVEVAAEQAAPRSGVALSGGLDSTVLAAALKASGSAPGLRAFVGAAPQFPEADESGRAEAVSRHLGLESTVVRADLERPLRQGFTTARGTPHFFYYTEWWEALLGRAQTVGTETVFSGGGGDHLFAGVSPYPDLLLTGRWSELWDRLRRHAGLQTSGGFAFLVRRRLLGPILYAYLPWWRRRCLPAPAWLGRRLRDAYREAVQKVDAPLAVLPGRIHRMRCIDVPRISQFCEDLNRRAEARGVRLRHPLLDHRLVEFALAIPSWRSARAGWDKLLLRDAAEGRLPPEVAATRQKVVPGPILRSAVAQRRDDLLEGLLTSMRTAELGWVEPERLRGAVDLYCRGGTRDSTFWFALTLEDWLRRHF